MTATVTAPVTKPVSKEKQEKIDALRQRLDFLEKSLANRTFRKQCSPAVYAATRVKWDDAKAKLDQLQLEV